MYNRLDLLKKLGWSTTASIIQMLVGIASVVVLTRYLTPTDYGLFGVALIAILAADVLTNGVLASKLEQMERPDREMASSIFWANGALAMIFIALVFGLSKVISIWLKAPEAVALIQAATVLVAFDAISAVPRAIIKQNQKFRAMSKINMIASPIGLVVGISMALSGYGAWALLGMEVSRRAANCVLSLWVARWRPDFVFSPTAFKSSLSFGLAMFAGAVIGRLDKVAPRIATAILLGPAALGILSVAYRIADQVQAFIAGPLGAMALPVFSKYKSDRAVFHKLMTDSWKTIALITFPACAGIAAILPNLVPWMVGTGFELTGPLAAISVLASLRIAASKVNLGASQALGRNDLANLSMLIGFATHLVLLAVLCRYGLFGIVAATLIRAYVTWPAAAWLLKEASGFPMIRQVKVLAPAFLASLAVFASAFSVGHYQMLPLEGIKLIAAQVATGLIVFIVLFPLFDRDARKLVPQVLNWRLAATDSFGLPGQRIAWVDYAKGICIILVVMMHATNGVEWGFGEQGWLRPLVDFARPFRMPDFFLISGLFLSLSLHGPLRGYIDRKVIHFAYFYLLWLTIQQTVFEPGLLLNDPIGFGKLWLKSLIEPTNSLWFVHMLAIFYVFTRMIRNVPPILVLIGAFGMQSLYQFGYIDTGWTVADRFSNRYVYFYFGYACAPYIFAFATSVRRQVLLSAITLVAWGVLNWLAVQRNLHNEPLSSFVLGMAGATAICAISSLLADRKLAAFLRYSGQHSIVIYLTFAIVLKAMEKIYHTYGLPMGDIGLASAISLVLAVCAPLAFHALIHKSWLNMVYARPPWAKLPDRVLTSLAIPAAAKLEN